MLANSRIWIVWVAAGCAVLLAAGAPAAVVTQYSFEGALLDTAAAGGTPDHLTATTRSGTLSTTYQTGVVGQAVKLSNAATQAYLLSATDSNDLDLGGNYTLEAFVNPQPEHADTWHRLAVKWFGGAQQYHFALEGSGDNLDLHMNGGSTLNQVTPVPAGQWSHVAFTGDSAADKTEMWYNGTVVGSTGYVGVVAGGAPLEFGNTAGGGGNLQYSGLVDEVLIHDEAKDTTYMQGRAALLPPPPVPELVGHWTFDDGTGTPALLADTSTKGSDNSGTFNAGTTPAQAPGVVGGALELFGNQNIDVGSSADYDSPSWTAAMWLKNDPGVTGWRTALGDWDPGSTTMHIGRNTNGTWGDHGGGQTSGTTVVDDTWYHVVSRRTLNSQENSLWVNGVKQSQVSFGAPDVPGLENIYIGTKNGTGNPWDGLIDDLGYWSEPLSDGEVRALFTLGLPTSLGSAFGLNYDQAEVELLFLAHRNQGAATVRGTPWVYADGLSALAPGGTAAGDLFTSGGTTYLLLDGSGNGTGLMIGRIIIPEPATCVIWTLLLLFAAGCARRRIR